MDKENKDLEKTDVIEEENDENKLDDIDDVTRKIDLNDLYDGAVNNTVIIDPVTQNELLYKKRKPNITFIIILIAIIILLGIYYITNKSDFTRTDTDVASSKTTTTTKKSSNSGFINCKYNSKSDTETIDALYNFTYEEDKIVKRSFEYSLVNTSDVSSDVATNLEREYELLYTNNSTVKGFRTRFNKTSKGFTFSSNTTYNKVNFNDIKIEDNQTLLFIMPSLDDTALSVNNNYKKKGFTCTVTKEE